MSYEEMFIVKSQLTKREESELSFLIGELPDLYKEFYLTKNYLRLYIKDNLEVLFDLLKRGDKIIFDKEKTAIAIIIGFADKKIKIFDINTKQEKLVDSRKFVKILSKDETGADRILKIVNWHFSNIDLFTKLKKENPIIKVFYDNGYKFNAGRGFELLLKREKRIYNPEPIPNKE